MNCHVHKQYQAEGICVYCGKFFCQECLVEVEGRNFCKEHVKYGITAEALHLPSRGYSSPAIPQEKNLVIHNQVSNTSSSKSHSGFVINGYGFHFAFQVLCLMGILGAAFIMLFGFLIYEKVIILFGGIIFFMSFVFMALDRGYCNRI